MLTNVAVYMIVICYFNECYLCIFKCEWLELIPVLEPGPVPTWHAGKNTGQSKPTVLPSANMNALRSRKVSNASQDATRPTAATNRLSPSKRTNDMPQINSSLSGNISKHVYKTSIQGECILSTIQRFVQQIH